MTNIEKVTKELINSLQNYQQELEKFNLSQASSEPPTETKDCKEGEHRKVIEPFEQSMLAELKELDERTRRLGLFINDTAYRVKKSIYYTEGQALDKQYEAMKAYRSALYERCTLRKLL